MAEETITLPKSGLVLKYDQPCGEYTLRLCDDVSLNIAHVYAQNHWGWHAWVSTNDDSGEKGSRDECLAWLDARVIELRAALLPPGAIVVSDTPETRERLARVIYGEYEGQCTRAGFTALPMDEMRNKIDPLTGYILAALREPRP